MTHFSSRLLASMLSFSLAANPVLLQAAQTERWGTQAFDSVSRTSLFTNQALNSVGLWTHRAIDPVKALKTSHDDAEKLAQNKISLGRRLLRPWTMAPILGTFAAGFARAQSYVYTAADHTATATIDGYSKGANNTVSGIALKVMNTWHRVRPNEMFPKGPHGHYTGGQVQEFITKYMDYHGGIYKLKDSFHIHGVADDVLRQIPNIRIVESIKTIIPANLPSVDLSAIVHPHLTRIDHVMLWLGQLAGGIEYYATAIAVGSTALIVGLVLVYISKRWIRPAYQNWKVRRVEARKNADDKILKRLLQDRMTMILWEAKILDETLFAYRRIKANAKKYQEAELKELDDHLRRQKGMQRRQALELIAQQHRIEDLVARFDHQLATVVRQPVLPSVAQTTVEDRIAQEKRDA